MAASTLHPELARARFIPQLSFGPRSTRLIRRVKVPARRPPADIHVENLAVAGAPGTPPVRVRTYRPRSLTGQRPALYWMHGGGYVIGSPEQDDRRCIAFARSLGITVASVDYRLAPDHPAPAALDDAYAGLRWLASHAESHEVDADRIAIGGASAGGGLAAALALAAHDRGEVTPAFQLLLYPMLDDRTVLRTDLDDSQVRLWTAGSNRFGWGAYLGRPPGASEVSAYEAPARRGDLRGLPPAWIGVGTLDLLHDEDIDYARRLQAADVACALDVVPGAFHGFDVAFERTEVARGFHAAQVDALRDALL